MSKKSQKHVFRFVNAVPITQVKSLVNTLDRDVADSSVDWDKGYVELLITTPDRKSKMILVPLANVKSVEVLDVDETPKIKPLPAIRTPDVIA